MNNRTTEDIIGALYDMIQDARAMPLAADKCTDNIFNVTCVHVKYPP